MNNIPFYKIFIGKIDITDFISSFVYEDCINEDDLIKFNIEAPTKDLLESDLLKVGKQIIFQYGYFGGVVSSLKNAVIKDIEYNYDKITSISIVALDIGNNMKKAEQQKVWQNKTASQIAFEIAKKYELKTDKIQNTTFIYTNLPQGNKTDFELLTYLAKREKNGSFRFFIKNKELCFNRLALENETGIKFTLGEDIISFKPALKDSQKDGASAGVASTSFDPLTKKTNTFETNPKTSLDNLPLGNNTNTANDKNDKEVKIKYDAYNKIIK